MSRRQIWTRRLTGGGAALLAAAALVGVVGTFGGADGPTDDRSTSSLPVAGSFPPDAGGRPDPATTVPDPVDGAGAGMSGTVSPGGGRFGSGGSAEGRPDEERSGGARSARSGPGGSAGPTGPTSTTPTITAAAGPDGSFTVGADAADWLVLAAGANGTVTRAPDPAVRVGYEHRNARLWRDGPFRISFTGGAPVKDLRDTARWMLLSKDGGRVDLSVPALDRPRSLLLYIGGGDAVVTAGGERAVVPKMSTATVTVALPPSADTTAVTLTAASSEEGHRVGIAAVELR